MNIQCTSAHAPKRARCEQMAAELTALREQVEALTKERDEARNSRTGRRFTAMSEHIGQLVDDVTRLRAVLADAEAVVERHVPAAGDEIEDESGICEASTLEDIRNVLAATSSSTVRPSWAATEVPR